MKFTKFLPFFGQLILMNFVQAIDNLNYTDLEDMGAACPPEDTCSIQREPEKDTLDLYRCQCKAACIKSNTCCIDSEHFTEGTIHNKRRKGRCQGVFRSNMDVVMVSKCDTKWRGNGLVKTKCESPPTDISDPISLTPVTNSKSETTYSNYFCAVCNREVQFLELWDIKITKIESNSDSVELNMDERQILRELIFDHDVNKWGLVSKDVNGTDIFEAVHISFTIPDRLKKMVSRCFNNLVSECHENWTDYEVRQKCHSYMAVVYIKSNTTEYNAPVAYRNIHCAVCNYQEYLSETICAKYKTSITPTKPPLSFTMLLDVNLKDGNEVGKVNPCEKGNLFDPFFKKCRILSCGMPGYILKDDKCIPPNSQ